MKTGISLTDETRFITNPRTIYGLITVTAFLVFFVLGVKWEANSASNSAQEAKTSIQEIRTDLNAVNADRQKNIKEFMNKQASLETGFARLEANQENMQKSLDRIERLIERHK